MNTTTPDQAITFLYHVVDVWFQAYMRWLWTGEIIGCAVVIGSIAVAASPPFLTRAFDIKNVAFVVAGLAAINTFIDPLKRADGYGSALTKLQVALEEVSLMSPGSSQQMDAIKKAYEAEALGLNDIRERSVATYSDRSTVTSKPK